MCYCVSVVTLILYYMLKEDQVSSCKNTESRPIHERNPLKKLSQQGVWKVTSWKGRECQRKVLKYFRKILKSGGAGSETIRLAKKWINNQHQSTSLIWNDSHHHIYCMWVGLWSNYDPSSMWLCYSYREISPSSMSFNHLSISWSKPLLIFSFLGCALNLYQLQDTPKCKSLKKRKDETLSFLFCVYAEETGNKSKGISLMLRISPMLSVLGYTQTPEKKF